ncbi:MAG: homoserine dehydrogenase [Campylobacter sp.]|nr:homoserine dehydrogenase [Campylobacter sp.]
MRVAILGVGTVGEAVIKILKQNQELITARGGEEIIPVVGVVRNLNKFRNVDIELSDDLDAVTSRDDIDVFVELMGGIEKPYEVVSKILKLGKPVVTANKALLAYHRYTLQSLAGLTPFGYEASVAGGVPIIGALREGLSANHIISINGILNGTSNYILSSMMNKGENFADALRKAQSLGYAEADPSFDIGGFDTAHKLLILASIAYGVNAVPEDILIEGIEKITAEDIFFANDFDFCIKLLAVAKKFDDKIELRVHPTLVPKDKMIAKTSGVTNAISVVGDAVGETMFYGPGAGGAATASAVVSDLVAIARKVKTPMLGFKNPITEKSLGLLGQNEIRTKYYFRLKVADELGTLAKITNIMSQNQLSIDSFLQKPGSKEERNTTLFFTTHTSFEADVRRVINLLQAQDFILEKPFMMRIEM